MILWWHEWLGIILLPTTFYTYSFPFYLLWFFHHNHHYYHHREPVEALLSKLFAVYYWNYIFYYYFYFSAVIFHTISWGMQLISQLIMPRGYQASNHRSLTLARYCTFTKFQTQLLPTIILLFLFIIHLTGLIHHWPRKNTRNMMIIVLWHKKILTVTHMVIFITTRFFCSLFIMV
jgi:hypothetical protein